MYGESKDEKYQQTIIFFISLRCIYSIFAHGMPIMVMIWFASVRYSHETFAIGDIKLYQNFFIFQFCMKFSFLCYVVEARVARSLEVNGTNKLYESLYFFPSLSLDSLHKAVYPKGFPRFWPIYLL